MGPDVRVAFANGQRSWSEDDNLVESLAKVLRELGHEPRVRDKWIEVGSGLTLLPQVVQVQPVEPSGVRTQSTIQIAHESLVPQGVFEFQISAGDDVRDSFSKGFKNWAALDLPVFLDAQRAKPENSLFLDLRKDGAKDPTLIRDRRVVLGPIQQVAQKPPATDEEHSFCSCCLFTNSYEALKELIATDAFFGIRLFATRDAAGGIQADCRVNGIDWPNGVEALRKYVSSWPDRGFEYRKQYVCIRSLQAGASA